MRGLRAESRPGPYVGSDHIVIVTDLSPEEGEENLKVRFKGDQVAVEEEEPEHAAGGSGKGDDGEGSDSQVQGSGKVLGRGGGRQGKKNRSGSRKPKGTEQTGGSKKRRPLVPNWKKVDRGMYEERVKSF